MKTTFVIFIYYIYALALIGGTAYLVFFQHHSGWWFVLTFLFTANNPKITIVK